jgi:hypothetical protein
LQREREREREIETESQAINQANRRRVGRRVQGIRGTRDNPSLPGGFDTCRRGSASFLETYIRQACKTGNAGAQERNQIKDDRAPRQAKRGGHELALHHPVSTYRSGAGARREMGAGSWELGARRWELGDGRWERNVTHKWASTISHKL